MCAIAGIIGQLAEFQQKVHLASILAAMTHRGPDSTDIEILENHGCFGHNRLSIIDLNERAKQPMWDYSQRFCLSFNGEIYNFQSLKKELRQLGHQFRTQSDSEVLIEAWAEWGIASINRLVGMFAFAVWDRKDKQLYLVRDRMGEKPLYFSSIKQNFTNGLVFASELKGLIKYPFVKKSLSMTALSHYLSFNYTSTDDAIFEGIHKLPPAAYLHYNLNTHQYCVKEYWSLAESFHDKLAISFDDATAELNYLLAESVNGQVLADVPLGAFLSGGIDSAAVVSHMRRNNLKQVNTYSIGFKEKTYNELPLSQKTAQHLGVNHQAKIVFPPISHLLPKLISSFDEPFADTSLIPTYLLCDFAKKHVTVSLSGDGGDELFGGYITYQADRYHQFMQHLPIATRKMLLKLSHYLPTSFNKISWDYKIKQFLRGSLLDFKSAHTSWREIFNPDQKKLLWPEWVEHNSKDWFNDVADCHYLDQAMYVDMKTWLVDDILVKVDRVSMAHSLEVRTPFLDHRLVQFAARMPISYKIHNRQSKCILRASHARYLPPAVLRQPKKGFNSPISYWLSNELFELAYEVTTSQQLTTWFNKSAIEKMWYEHRNSLYDNGHRLFNLLCLGLWCQSYL
ncbi:MAG: asparagine synthase (glutamine-hydrolyzing) [Gammaproteobacteria bacterium RIFCSPHIGHO2_12_FULL_37_14]|nr:MAG: asparagine synthase (glutamine-hydrolyzing) [Gammaproteobacteria bacterium RIFCSPHIGHO2_12_FULL_37_14]